MLGFIATAELGNMDFDILILSKTLSWIDTWYKIGHDKTSYTFKRTPPKTRIHMCIERKLKKDK